MHRIRLERRPRTMRGVTLIELVVAMVLVGIIVGATVYFVYPLRQAADLATRAQLTDIADNSLQRIARDVRIALPNSVRVHTSQSLLEFIPVITAGRYRVDGGGAQNGADCPDTGVGLPGSDQLSFDVADTCFKTIGPLPNAGQIVVNTHFLVLNNYGAGFTGQDAYANGAANRRLITSLGSPPTEIARHRIGFGSTTFQRTLHDSPGKRFYVVAAPVSYVCDTGTGTLIRYTGYGFTTDGLQPTTFGTATPTLIAEHVSGCVFNFSANVAPQVGLLTLSLTLSQPRFDGVSETVNLYHSVHVSNVP